MSGDDNQCCNAEQCKSPELDLWPVLYIRDDVLLPVCVNTLLHTR